MSDSWSEIRIDDFDHGLVSARTGRTPGNATIHQNVEFIFNVAHE